MEKARQRMRLLVVDDDSVLLRSLRDALSDEAEVRCCADAASARRVLASWRPDVVVLDVVLPDGNAFDVLQALRGDVPMPLVVAISGAADPPTSFRLAQQGVRAFLSKPFAAPQLRQAIETARQTAPDLDAHLRAQIGFRSLPDVEQQVRETLLQEAMARADGRKKGAAKLLGVSRQLLQHALRRLRS